MTRISHTNTQTMKPEDINEQETTSAEETLVTRRRTHRKPASDQLLGLRNVLNIIFMFLAVAGVVTYLWIDDTIGTYIIIAGMAFKMVECCLRMLR